MQVSALQNGKHKLYYKLHAHPSRKTAVFKY